jgi:1,2-dihydroxy-3-keto-5-methylthiopentene dioxygenase
MSELRIHREYDPNNTIAWSDDPASIRALLADAGVRFETWRTDATLPAAPTQDEVLAAYRADIDRLMAEGGYTTADVVSMVPDHPDRATMRTKFLEEHTHSEDEVRFFVEGRGLFCLHLGDEVLQLICEADDWIAVPAGTRHWFDMGPEPNFCALRFFHNPDGWVAQFTGESIAEDYPLLDELLVTSRG